MKKLFALLMVLVMMFSFASTAMAEFNEDEPITRGMFISVIYRIEETRNVEMPEYPNVFDDVEAESLYAPAIAWAAAEGIVNGVSDVLYDPDTNITREQMATIMYRYYNYKGIAPKGAWAIKLNYADTAKISDYAVSGVMLAELEGVLTADENGKFNPKADVVGDELAALIGNIYDKVK